MQSSSNFRPQLHPAVTNWSLYKHIIQIGKRCTITQGKCTQNTLLQGMLHFPAESKTWLELECSKIRTDYGQLANSVAQVIGE